jgi:hypothetical protein
MKPIHFCCTIALSAFLLHQSHSQGETAVPFLLIYPSPDANGWGNVGTAVISDNPISTIANPAQLGIFSLSHYFSASSYAPKTNWLPVFGLSDLTYSVWAVQGGYDISKELSLPFPISVGAAYSRIDLNLGEFERRDANNTYLGTFESHEYSENISVAIGVDYFVKAGIGWNFKSIRSVLASVGPQVDGGEAKASATDFGLMIQAPLFDILKKAGTEQINLSTDIEPLFNLTFGYASSNLGNARVVYVDASRTDPLPRNVTIGLNAEIGITMNVNERPWKMFAFTLAREAEDLLVVRKPGGSFEFQSGLGDISFFDNVILGKVNSRENVHKGWQLNFGDFIFVRGGSFSESPSFGNRNYVTSGFGIRISGLFKTMQVVSPESMENTTFAFIAKHFDFGYDHARYDAENGHPLGRTTFNALTLVIR